MKTPFLAAALALGLALPAVAQDKILNVSYDISRELFEALMNAPAGGHDPEFIREQLAALAAGEPQIDWRAAHPAPRPPRGCP